MLLTLTIWAFALDVENTNSNPKWSHSLNSKSSTINSEVSGTSVYFWGEGSITKEVVQAAGTHTLFKEITIRSGPSEISGGAFSGCSSLVKLYISETVSTIGSGCFSSTPKMTTFEVSPSSKYLWSDGIGLYNIDKTRLIRVAQGITQYQILSSVESIDGVCLAGNVMDEIVVPKNVVSIGGDAFQSGSIKEVKFQEGSKYEIIKRATFWYQTAKIVHIPPSVREVQDEAFVSGNCKEIIFDDIKNSNLVKILQKAFSGNSMESFKLPSKIVSFPDNSFSDMSVLEEINIPAMCSSISATAFAGCPKLVRITIDSGNSYFKYNSDGALTDTLETTIYMLREDCTSLEVSKTINNIASSVLQARKISVLTVHNENPKYASFENVLYTKGYANLIAIPGGVLKAKIHDSTSIISEKAAQGTAIQQFDCKSSKKLTTIQAFAFSSSKLTSFIFPSSIQTLFHSVFLYCNSITSVTFPPECTLIKRIEYNTFRASSLAKIWLCDSIETLSYSIFCNDYSLTHVYISPNSKLNMIDRDCFLSCPALANWTFYPKVKKIGSNAFFMCQKLVADFSQNELESIGDSAFIECTSITEVSLKSTLTSIGVSAFSKCTSLRRINFANAMKISAFGSSCFSGCTSLPEVIIPNSITSIDYSVFFNCQSLTKIKIAEGSSVLTEKGNLIYKDNVLLFCPGGLQSATVADGVLGIAGNAFYSCQKLQSVVFPNLCKIEVIKTNTFGECVKLESIEIPQSIVTLESNSFSGCIKLRLVEFQKGSKLDKIGEGTFLECIGLENVTFGQNSLLKYISPSAFKGCSNLMWFTFPDSLQSIGSNAFEGTGIKKIAFGLKSSVKPSVDSFDGMEMLENITFSGKTASIEAGMFKGCGRLRSIIFPESAPITEIPDGCFKNVIALEEIQLSRSITKIGQGAFEGLSHLCEVSGIQNIASFGNSSFKNTAIQQLVFKSTRVLGESAFESCTNLKSVSFILGDGKAKSTLQVIPKLCFYRCESLTELSLNGITEIKEDAFGKTGIVNLIMPKSVETVNERSFGNCVNLEKILIEGAKITIRDEAFVGSPKLQLVMFCGSKADTSKNAIDNTAADTQSVVVYVPVYYRGISFCGLPVSKRVDGECQLLHSVLGDPHYASESVIIALAASGCIESPEGSFE